MNISNKLILISIGAQKATSALRKLSSKGLLVAGLVLVPYGVCQLNAMESKIGTHYKVPTSQGEIAVWDSQGKGHPVLLIHGNSASGEVFKKQFQSKLGKEYRLIAPDLPAHGNSDIAASTDTYSFPGYARVIVELINKLGLKNVAVVGWSLGGHIALELSQMIPDKLSGILITGTPPIALSPEGISKGFRPMEGLHLLGHEPQFTQNEAKFFMSIGGFDVENEEAKFIVDGAIKTKGIARKYMFESMGKGVGDDETKIVANMTIPLAIVAGEFDKGINTEYIINDVTYSSLWNNQVNIIKNAGHAVFWEAADEFNAILSTFLKYVYK